MPDPAPDTAAGTPCLMHGQPVYHTIPGNCGSVSLVPVAPGSAAIAAHPTDIPGLFDVQMPDGSWRNDLTQGQVTSLAMQMPWARLEMARRAWPR